MQFPKASVDRFMMIQRQSKAPVAAVLWAVILAGCANPRPAPIEYRRVLNQVANIFQSTPEPSAEPVPAGYYRVKSGDTIIGIALENGVSWRDIVNWNQLANPNLIEVGQLLRVRGSGGPAPADMRASAPQTSAVPQSAPAVPASAPVTPAQPSAPVAVASAPVTPAKPVVREATKEVARETTKAAPTVASGSSSSSRWGWPGNGNVVGQFSDSGSKGISISGNEGDPVVAAGDGRVVYSGSGLRGYGNLVIVKHDDDFLTAYAHNKSIMVSEGQSVKRGQKIAELGKTDSDVPKLHFEVRKSGKPVDPMTYLPPR